MTRHLIALFLAVSVSVTSLLPVAAQAEEERDRNGEIGALVFGLTAILIATQLAKGGDDDDDDTPSNAWERPREEPREVPEPGEPTGRRLEVFPKQIPAHCFVRIQAREEGRVEFFASRCLRNNYEYFHRLPRRCNKTVIEWDGTRRSGYLPRCLERHGYTFVETR